MGVSVHNCNQPTDRVVRHSEAVRDSRDERGGRPEDDPRSLGTGSDQTSLS